jgi:excisionase family DNA binding protein
VVPEVPTEDQRRRSDRDGRFLYTCAVCGRAARDREPAKRWLTAREAGAYLGCSERAVHQRIRRGRIPAEALRHQGRRLLLDRLALDRALERA